MKISLHKKLGRERGHNQESLYVLTETQWRIKKRWNYDPTMMLYIRKWWGKFHQLCIKEYAMEWTNKYLNKKMFGLRLSVYNLLFGKYVL